MTDDGCRCLLVSDFNVSPLSGYLVNSSDPPRLRATVAPFGQVMPTLLDPAAAAWRDSHDVAIVWTRPEGIIEGFDRVLDCAGPPIDELLVQVDAYSDAIIGIKDRVAAVLVPSWVVAGYHRGLGLIDLKDGGVQNALWRANARLAANLRAQRNLYLLDTQRWLHAAGPAAFNPKFWYMAKMAFSNDVFKSAAFDIKAAIRAISGSSKKLLVLDLDDTLWGGVVGEIGWQELKLGGHDPIGEAFVDFQRAVRALKNRGIVLAIVSKNDEATALEAIRTHPEMVLRLDDFVAWRINWNDKAANLADLATQLNVGLQSVVFIDDQPAERGRVREALPEVFVPEWPVDKMLFKKTLQSLSCFDTVSISQEDLQRTEMYSAERIRQQGRASVSSVDQWLRSLKVTVTIEPLSQTNLARATQLLNKTNQMNLSTRRLAENQLEDWIAQGHRKIWCFRVADRYGDSGLTGILSVDCEGNQTRIVDFLLSCRVFGRQVESLMIHTAVEYARCAGTRLIAARYMPTEKNKPCLECWLNSGFEHDPDSGLFSWDTSRPYAAPDFIEVIERVAPDT